MTEEEVQEVMKMPDEQEAGTIQEGIASIADQENDEPSRIGQRIINSSDVIFFGGQVKITTSIACCKSLNVVKRS
jgi:hypothetical protein